MSDHNFKIHAPLNSNDAFIEMDGKRLEGVTRIEFALAARQLVEVKLTIYGYVDITGDFRESEIIRVEREGEHPGMLSVRLRRALQHAFPGMDSDQIRATAADVMRGLQRESS